jgi:hypothetical protein
VIICKTCGHQNEDGAKFCGSCSAFLEWSGEEVKPEPKPEPQPPKPDPRPDGDGGPSPEPPPPPPPPPGEVLCPACGTSNEAGRAFCRSCASELVPTTTPIPALPPPHDGPRVPAVAIATVAGLAVIVIAGAFALGLFGRGPAVSPGAGTIAPTSAAPSAASVAPSVASVEPSVPPGPAGLLVFAVAADAGGNLELAAPDGSGRRPLYTSDRDDFDPFFSPDGTEVVFASGANLRITAVDGSGDRGLTSDDGGDRNPAWSASGMIAFARLVGRGNLVAMAPLTKPTIRTAIRSSGRVNPAWSCASRARARRIRDAMFVIASHSTS